MKKIFLNTLITSVALSALIGIIVILIGNYGDFEQKVLMTTFAVTCSSILGLACGPAYESGRRRWLPLAGIVLAVTAGVCWIVLVWVDLEPGWYVGRGIMTVTLLALVLAHLSLVSQAELDRRFVWASYSLYTSVVLLTLILLALIWVTDTFESDITFRALGALAIITAALTILMPIFHRLSGSADDAEKIDAEIERLMSRLSELEERKQSLEQDRKEEAEDKSQDSGPEPRE